MKKVLVCGDRDFSDYPLMDKVLSEFIQPEDVLIHGAARGADKMSEEWRHRQYPVPEELIKRYPADWTTHGKAAGPIRNKQMLDEGKPDLVIAFLAPDSKGTKNMINQASAAGVEVQVINLSAGSYRRRG